ncbi:MAG: Flp pilus assembly complex ATPase component TadA, partial [Candidatus Omnitrophica bacterium]|nr:Flp pilus assembly complex ATPase component TadA [Candidatus Omnitrophota bacterium]
MTVAPKLGQLLVQKKLLTESQLQEAIQEQGRSNRSLGTILVERGWLSSEQMLETMAQQYGMPFRRLHDVAIDRAVVEKVPLKVALHYKVMPLALHDSKLTVAMSDPQDIRIVDDLRLALQQRYNIEPVLATEEDIVGAMRRYYGLGAETIDQLVTQRTNGTQAPVAEDAVEDIEHLASDASVVKLVNQLILEAHTRRATDIHLEPYRGKVRLRYRIDGLLHDVDVPPTIRQLFPAIVSRVKVLSNLNLVERRLPQDGRASVKVGAEKIDLRTSILPTTAGESVVIRILPNQMLLDLKELGYREEHIKELETLIRRPYGLIFVTGPTGSGKTTTLYACLKTINTEERKIITIEDPVEYELEGVAQLHVNPVIGLSFAQGLRSMLRHDPDVMMVGEVRDLETAELAIRIALTGHLVFSTLHTNDAASGVT